MTWEELINYLKNADSDVMPEVGLEGMRLTREYTGIKGRPNGLTGIRLTRGYCLTMNQAENCSKPFLLSKP